MKIDEYTATLKDLDVRISRLKSLYEQWVTGIERLEPVRERERVDKLLRELGRRQPNNTAAKFRYQTLRQRWVTLTTHWARVSQQMENGTHRRQVARAQRRMLRNQTVPPPAPEAEEREPRPQAYELDLADANVDVNELFGESDVDSALDDFFGKKPPAPPPPPGAPAASAGPPPAPAGPPRATFGKPKERPRAPAATFGRPKGSPPAPPATPARPAARKAGPTEPRMRAIYDEYVAARRKNNERVDNVRYEKLQKSIEKMVPKLREKHAGKDIDFKVVVKNGRVGLKPVTK